MILKANSTELRKLRVTRFIMEEKNQVSLPGILNRLHIILITIKNRKSYSFKIEGVRINVGLLFKKILKLNLK